MKYLLDTNILSELTKPSPLKLLVEWLDEHEGDSAISAVTIGELVRGVEAVPQGKKRNRLFRHVRFSKRIIATECCPLTSGWRSLGVSIAQG